jgi:selenide,water dikinase
VRKAGCASKIPQADLLRILGRLPAVDDPNILVGVAAGDDAGVYKLDDNTALVQTVDVFTPCVDDPYRFGQIAAANSVSDVYAMGGRPLTALSIAGFPSDDLDGTILEAMLRGGLDKMAEAECRIIGGHSINDAEIKLGYAVTGLIHPSQPVQRNRARPGDVLVLTKPLGTGMVAFAAQIGRVDDVALDEVGASMSALNKDAAELMVKFAAHACTDITGYGLAGHLVEMARGSKVCAEVDLSALPVFRAAADCLAEGIMPGAIERNEEYAMAWVRADGPAAQSLPIIYDPQTSGGLLIALPDVDSVKLVRELHKRGLAAATVIGRISRTRGDRTEGRVVVKNARLTNYHGKGRVIAMSRTHKETTRPSAEVHATDSSSCCGTRQSAGSANALDGFMDFMKAAAQPGAVDAKTKKLCAIALSITVRCRPCLEIHMREALRQGITQGEIDEIAAMATGFGGCAALMFYREVCREMHR